MDCLKQFIQTNKATLLCSGPMSQNSIDASIELSKQYNVPQLLIASRRQIDDVAFGGGYVAPFTTQAFAEYVNAKNAPLVFLARDHGGPWQSIKEVEQHLTAEQAMASAKRSFEADIRFGFTLLHLDPSIPIQGEPLTLEIILNRLFELYGHCYECAQRQGKTIYFELGTEEQDGYGQNLEQFEYFLSETDRFLKKNKLPAPSFVVAQTGTKVLETQNVGVFSTGIPAEITKLTSHIQATLALCSKHGLMLKEHNTDYLSNEALALRPLLGIHASNVAPEFGVTETKGLLYLMEHFGYQDFFDTFVDRAVASNKWKKWLLPNSTATDVDKALICGHYVFSDEQVMAIKRQLTEELKHKGIYVDQYLKKLIKQAMLRYMQLFGMIK